MATDPLMAPEQLRLIRVDVGRVAQSNPALPCRGGQLQPAAIDGRQAK